MGQVTTAVRDKSRTWLDKSGAAVEGFTSLPWPVPECLREWNGQSVQSDDSGQPIPRASDLELVCNSRTHVGGECDHLKTNQQPET